MQQRERLRRLVQRMPEQYRTCTNSDCEFVGASSRCTKHRVVDDLTSRWRQYFEEARREAGR